MAVLAVLTALPLVGLIVVAGLRAPIGVLLAAYGAILPLGSGITIPVGLPSPFNSVTSVAGMLVVIAMLLHLVLTKQSARDISPTVPAWLTFAAFAGMSIAWSVNPSQTGSEFFLLISLLAVYVVAMLMPISQRDLSHFEIGVAGGGAVAGAYAIVLALTSSLQLTRRNVSRFSTAGGVGESTDANITAATLILPFAIAVGRALRAENRTERLLFGIAGALTGAGIILTGSRGGMLAALVTLLVLLFEHSERARAVVAIVFLSALASLALVVAPTSLRKHISRSTSSGRTDIWRTALAACPTYCWAGAGWGSFPTVYQDTLHTNPSAKGLDRPFVAHDIWISAIIELGVAGLVALLIALGIVLRDILRVPRMRRGPPLAAFLGILVASTFLSTLSFKYFWLVMIYAGFVAMVHAPRHTAVRERVAMVELRPVLG